MINEKEISPTALRIFWWKPSAALRVAGPDSFTFLQAQMTNDLRTAAPREGVYTLWLDHKGHVQGDAFVATARPEEFWVFSERTRRTVLRERLESHIIADDVVVEDGTDEWCGLTVIGAAEPRFAQRHGLLPLARREGAGQSIVCACPAESEAAVRARLAAMLAVKADEVERWRIAAGIPAVPDDIGPGELPQEGALERGAVSFTKGCYLGQEVMARLSAMGQVRRQLLRVRGEGPCPPRGSALYQGERRVGEMRSGVAQDSGFIGFALLSTLHLQPQLSLSVLPNQSGRMEVWQ